MAKECYFTPVKGSCSCRGCKYSFDPEQYDAGCRLPTEVYKRAVKGKAPRKPFIVRTIENEVTK